MHASQDIFQGTVAKSAEWVGEVMSDLAISDGHQALRALRAGLHAIRDRLPLAEVVDLGAQLPVLVRGLYYEGWRPGHKADRTRHAADLYQSVRDEIGPDPMLRPEEIIRATVRALRRHVTAGELAQVEHVLPRRVAEVWRACLGDA